MPRHFAFKSLLFLGAVFLTTIAVHSVPADPAGIRERPDGPADRERIPDQVILKFKGSATSTEKKSNSRSVKRGKVKGL